MVPILYEDKDIIVVQKPAGLESQVSRGFAPDMVSEIRRYLHNPQDIQTIHREYPQPSRLMWGLSTDWISRWRESWYTH